MRLILNYDLMNNLLKSLKHRASIKISFFIKKIDLRDYNSSAENFRH